MSEKPNQSQASREYLEFVASVVVLLKQIRNNPTPARIDDLLIQLQAIAMDQ